MPKNRLRRHFSFILNILGFRNDAGTLGIYSFAHGRNLANRISIINHLIFIYGYVDYLEIGVRKKTDMHDKIIAHHRTSVDPDPDARADHVVTSDEFFRTNEKSFDIIFIDGLHTGEQVSRDISNSLDALRSGGCIVLHDLNPPTAFHAREEYEIDGEMPPWNGTSWQGYAKFRKTCANLEMFVIDVDWGVGFIRLGRQKCYEGPIETYQDLEENRSELLNLISVRDFLRRHPKNRMKYSILDPIISTLLDR